MKLLETEVIIEATPEKVWSILTDLASYQIWNPFIPNARGRLEEGGELEILIAAPDGKEITFKPKVTKLVDNAEFRWFERIGLPRILDGEHIFLLKNHAKGCLLIHKEQFKGLLVPLVWRVINNQIREGFQIMNQALKAQAEGRALSM